MILNKPKRLIAVINGFEIAVESPKQDQDALEFEAFCEALKVEMKKVIADTKVEALA